MGLLLGVVLLAPGFAAAQLRLRAEPGAAIPVGGYADMAKPGAGIQLSGRLPYLEEQLLVGLDVGYFQHIGQQRQLPAFAGRDYYLFDAYMSVPMHAAAEYVVWEQKPLAALAGLGAGATFLRTRTEFELERFVSGGDTIQPTLTKTRLRAFRFSLAPAAGLQLWFSKRFAFELVGRYTLIVPADKARDPQIGIRPDALGAPIQQLQLHLGVVLRFNRM
jgi:hypothetical protein